MLCSCQFSGLTWRDGTKTHLGYEKEVRRRGCEKKKTERESKNGRKGQTAVVTVIESERTPGTAAEASPSIQDSEPAHISPPQH